MPVAVRLVEALALVTLMAMITCVSLGVVLAQRTLSLTITFIEVPSIPNYISLLSILIPSLSSLACSKYT